MWQSNEISTVAFSTACTCTAAPWSTGVQVCVSRPTVTDVGAKSVITVSPWGAVRLIQKTLIWIYKWQETNHISSQHVTSCGNSSNIKLHITCCHSLTSIHYLKIRPERVLSTCYVYTVTVYYYYMELFWRDPIRALDTLDISSCCRVEIWWKSSRLCCRMRGMLSGWWPVQRWLVHVSLETRTKESGDTFKRESTLFWEWSCLR